jgi:chitinase
VLCEDTQGYWIFNGTTLWSFDDPMVIEVKMEYAKRVGLSGACSRAIDRDTSSATLLKAIAHGLSG